MYLDERSNTLLKEILSSSTVKNVDLLKKHNLTPRQLSYSLQKINAWLEDNSYPKITQAKSGYFAVDPVLFEIIGSQAQRQNAYIMSDDERAEWIILMIATLHEELSLNHFIDELEVSRNTVLNDIKLAKNNLKEFGLSIRYSRLHGYVLEGDEWDLRTYLISLIKRKLESVSGKELLGRFLSMTDVAMAQHLQAIEEVENYLNLHFIDNQIELLPFVLEVISRRIRKKKYIEKTFLVDYDDLSDTKEYEAVELLIKENSIPQIEKLYLTLQLLTTNINTEKVLGFADANLLKDALLETLREFEKNSCLQLVDKDKLLEKLLVHMRPAYYRIKYNLTTDYSMIGLVEHEFENLHYIVMDSLFPLEKLIGVKIPENESVFITLFIAGHLIEVEEELQTRMKAVVVCPSGLTISRLMQKNLQTLFPELFFYEAMSFREFKDTKVKYDLVFSNVPIATEKKFFLIQPQMNDKEGLQLRNKVLASIYQLGDNQLSVSKLLNAIAPFVEVIDKEKLEIALTDYLLPSRMNEKELNRDNLGLADILKPEHIVRIKSVKDWAMAIEIASQPLLQRGYITQDYVNEMINIHPVLSDYIVLRRSIAIPHAEIEKGSMNLGLSLLYIEDGIPLEDGSLVHFVTVLSAINKTAHLQTVNQLAKLSGKRKILEKIAQGSTGEEMYQYILEFTNMN